MSTSHKTIYKFLGIQGLSLIGSRLTAVAIGIWFVKETGTVTPLLLISLCNELPILFFGSLIGIAVDQLNRKTAILIGDAGQVLCTILLVFSLISGTGMAVIYMIVAIQGLFMALQSVASSALIPQMVHNYQLDRVNSFKEVLFPLAGIIAPFLAGMLYEPIGLVGIVIIDIVTFFICIISVACLLLPGKVNKDLQVEQGNLWNEAIEG